MRRSASSDVDNIEVAGPDCSLLDDMRGARTMCSILDGMTSTLRRMFCVW